MELERTAGRPDSLLLRVLDAWALVDLGLTAEVAGLRDRRGDLRISGNAAAGSAVESGNQSGSTSPSLQPPAPWEAASSDVTASSGSATAAPTDSISDLTAVWKEK